MNKIVYAQTLFAGTLFGLWPVLMKESGLKGNLAGLAFALGCSLVVAPFVFRDATRMLSPANCALLALAAVIGGCVLLPFILREAQNLPAPVNWYLAAGAIICGGYGLIPFNAALSRATPQQVGTLLVLQLLAQVSVAAIYQIITNRGLTLDRGMGFCLAAAASYLLLRPR